MSAVFDCLRCHTTFLKTYAVKQRNIFHYLIFSNTLDYVKLKNVLFYVIVNITAGTLVWAIDRSYISESL